MNMSDEQLATLKTQFMDRVGAGLLRPNGPQHASTNSMLQVGRDLRDTHVWNYPIWPGAIQVYQQLASTREWTISGPPRAVSRAVEWLNNTESVNPYTGMTEYGYDQFLKRRVLDYLLIGRTAMSCKIRGSSKVAPLRYVDPTTLHEYFRTRIWNANRTSVEPIRPDDEIWEYYGEVFRARDVVLHHPTPIGNRLFIAPTLHLLPMAILAWLLREYDTTRLDGRKIREVLLVAGGKLHGAIEQAIIAQIALHSGATPSEVGGIPVVEVSAPAPGTKLEDMIARLGISEMPEAFDRLVFMENYVNEIAAALGLSLRHFWNNEKTTNRALEEVQEQRQQQKGPSVFVRSEQRVLRGSRFLDQFVNVPGSLRMAFVEETDLASLQTRALVLKAYAEGVEKLVSLFGARADLDSFLSWMQADNIIPHELVLLSEEEVGSQPDRLEQQTGDASVMAKEGEEVENGDPQPNTIEKLEKSLGYDEAMMDSQGRVIGQRRRVYQSASLAKDTVKEFERKYHHTGAADSDIEAWVSEIKQRNTVYNQESLLQMAMKRPKYLATSMNKLSLEYEPALIQRSLERCLRGEELDLPQTKIVEELVKGGDAWYTH